MISGRKVAGVLAAFALALLIGPTAGLAKKITLKSDDGKISITGDLISFKNGLYTIRSNMGKIGVLAAGVTCVGQACPQTTAAAEPADASAAESLASPDPEPVADAAVLASIAEPSPAPVAQAASAPAAEPVVAVPVVAVPVVAVPV